MMTAATTTMLSWSGIKALLFPPRAPVPPPLSDEQYKRVTELAESVKRNAGKTADELERLSRDANDPFAAMVHNMKGAKLRAQIRRGDTSTD